MASAVMEFWPKTKLAIGPAIENGFYYDMEIKDLKPEDLAKIESRMRELIKEYQEFKSQAIQLYIILKRLNSQEFRIHVWYK